MRVFPLLLVLSGCDLFLPANPYDTAQYGEDCTADEDCGGFLVCASDNVCRLDGEPGTTGLGDECVATPLCRAGLVCDHWGTCAEEGSPGTGGLGDTCEEERDCQLGYQCVDGTCYGWDVPLWQGVQCADDDPGPARAFFEVPGSEPLSEFYRLPFPNDARRDASGRPNLDGHPSPGALLPLVGDVVGRVVDTVESELTDGWGNNQAVLLRFSQWVDTSSLTLALPKDGGTVGIVDLTPGEDYGTARHGSYRTSSGKRAYICQNWLGIAPPPGRAFKPGHVYAAYVTTGARADAGGAIGRDADFGAMLAASAPGDSRLSRAWAAYAPLRTWVADADVDLAVATVFTAGDPVQPLLDARDAVLDAPVPSASGLHLCDGGPGPYADGDDPSRGCKGSGPFSEVQGVIGLRQWQQGTPPFKDAEDGGRFDTSVAPRVDDVHFTLTLPDGAMPAGGWPLVIYGHGTGGSYNSLVREGLADMLASVATDGGTTVRFAMLGIDAIHHGPRRHEENWKSEWLALDPHAYDEDVLYFNPLNPIAGRDNAVQSAADHWQLTRWALDVDWTRAASPTGQAVRFDPGNIYYLGHSQGSVAGAAYATYEPALKAVVYSGAGGLFIESMLNKKKPNDLPTAISAALADPQLDRYHPLLNLAQAVVERSDAVNHNPYLHAVALAELPRRHVLQTYGIDDSYSPNPTQYAFARALTVEQASNGNPPLDFVGERALPAARNWGGTTAIVALYSAAAGRDAHFVIFDKPEAERQVAQFFATSVVDGYPTVVAP